MACKAMKVKLLNFPSYCGKSLQYSDVTVSLENPTPALLIN